MVTITDVAREAGVSKATVSYVLSNDTRISEQTTARVRKAINTLGYTVNHAARALSTKKNNVLGIVSPTNRGSYLSSFFGLHIYFLSIYAAKFGYDTLFIGSDDGSKAMRNAAASNKVDGFILMDVQDNDPRISAATELNIPTVVFGSPRSSLNIDIVDSDFASEANTCVTYLAKQNYREVIFYTWSKEIFAKKMGFALRFKDQAEKTADKLGVNLHIYTPENDESDPAGELERSLNLYPHAKAMLIHNESASIVAPQAFSAMGIRVPQDLSVLSVFPKQLMWSVLAPFVFIQTDLEQLSQNVVDVLISRINNPKTKPKRQLINFTLGLAPPRE